MIKVLVVDDSALMRKVLGDILRAAGDLEVVCARDGVEAIKCLHEFQPDIVTLDVTMPRMDGLACLDRIMVERPCPVLMVSSLTEAGADVTLEAMQLGAVDFIAKPAGTISLAVDEFGPALIERVRAAARARLRRTLRLTERVRLLANTRTVPRHSTTARAALPCGPTPATGAAPGAGAATVAGTLASRTVSNRLQAKDSVVLVGVSTGGPPALDALLSPLPADFPWPIVVAQHMPKLFTGPLSRRLDRLCALRVMEVTRIEPLTAGTVYIGRGDADIIVAMRSGGPVVMAAPAGAEYRWHPSVDRLVTTAMAHLASSRLIGVLMTGMGNDGAAAMTRLRQDGGQTIAEAEETAVVWGMPGELVRARGATFVTPLDAIARQLMDWAA